MVTGNRIDFARTGFETDAYQMRDTDIVCSKEGVLEKERAHPVPRVADQTTGYVRYVG